MCYSTPSTTKNTAENPLYKKCFEGCLEIVTLTCKSCNKNTCLKHRVHSCNPQTATVAPKITAKSAFDGVQVKNNTVSKKSKQVELMKAKLKSKGNMNIPPADRVYIQVQILSFHEFLFFSKHVKIGQIVDQVLKSNHISQTDKNGVYKMYYNDTFLPFNSTLHELINQDLLSNGSLLVLTNNP
jgi:hypothetical protein